MKHLTSYNTFINEGLIQSTSIEMITKHLVQKVGIDPEDIWISEGASPDLNRINIEFNSKNADKLKEAHNKMINVFGWYLSNVGTPNCGEPYWENEWIEDLKNEETLDETARILKWHVEEYGDENEAIFIYEPKFGKEYTKSVKTLYHVTDKDNVDKILKQGLLTKRKLKKSIHPERIYLALSKEAIEETYLDDYLGSRSLLEIDNSKLNLKLYYDINMKDAVYTTDSIPPQYIKRIS